MRKADDLRFLAGWVGLSIVLYLPAPLLAETPVHFNDAHLEVAVEAALGVSDPTPTQMLGLLELEAGSKDITDLTGLDYATNLLHLNLMANQISDLSPLAYLPLLTTLDLQTNHIDDLSVLAGLTHLAELHLNDNQISDITPLAGLTHLERLNLWDNQITDISPLAGLTRLTALALGFNQIGNIAPLAGLIHLGTLDMYANHVIDISPLLGLTDLYYLDLQNNSLNRTACTTYIPQILANNPGISFHYDACPDLCTLALACNGLGSVEIQVLSGWVSTTLTGWGTYMLDYGSQVTITVTAGSGWRFMGWSGAVDSPYRLLSFTLTDDWDMTAVFVQNPRTLGVTCGTGGKVTQPGVGAFLYERSTTIPIEAVPDRGYTFTGWTGTLVDMGCVADPNNSRTQVVLDSDGNVHATFSQVAQPFYESWEAAAIGVYSPANGSYFFADEGAWSLGDGLFNGRPCGSAPHDVRVLALDSGHALLVTSTDTKSQCTDTVWTAIDISSLAGSSDSIAIDPNTMISFHEVGRLDSPELHGAGKDCPDPPCFDNVSLLLTDNRGNQLAYVLQRPADVGPNIPNAYTGGAYREIFLDPSGISYQRNLYEDFATIPAFNPRDSEVRNVRFQVAQHGSAIIDDIIIGSGAGSDTIPVYHFWSPTLQTHFFTTGPEEKQSLIDTWSGVWTFEGISYYTVPPADSTDMAPVYRFWSPTLLSHFYTINEDERDNLLRQYPDVWSLEGVTFYVFAEGRQPADAAPVYRFWSPKLGCHFYTASEKERDEIVQTQSDTWTLEGVVWYAYPPDWDSDQALDLLAGR